MKRRARASTVAAVVVVAAPLLSLAAGTGCKNEVEVTIDLQVADGIADVVDIDNDLKNLTVNGVGKDFDETVPFPGDVDRLPLELLFLGGGSVVTGHGRTIVDGPPGDVESYGTDFKATMVIGRDDDVTELQALPPNLGVNSCATSDEGGRIFVVGGSASSQSGYGVDDDYFVRGLDDVDALKGNAVGCSARGGRVVAGACDGDAIVDLGLGDTVRVDVGVPTCGLFAAASDEDYWLISRDTAVLFSARGTQLDTSATGFDDDIDSVEALASGNAMVRLVNSKVFLVKRDPAQVTQVGQASALGRRFDDVVAIDGDRLLRGEQLDVANGAIGLPGTARAVTVLSDDTVAAIVDGDLVVIGKDAAGDTKTTTVPLSRNRARLAALPGDTILLAGDEGVDVVVLSSHTPKL